MSEKLHIFYSGERKSLVALPFQLEEVINAWNALRSVMIRNFPDEFTREEWAYLIQFISMNSLGAPFREYFGEAQKDTDFTEVNSLFKTRGTVGMWLPNNVTLLGPLMLVLLSLTGCRVRIKIGSRSKNVTGVFLEYAIQHLMSGALRDHLKSNITIEDFDHVDPRNAEMVSQVQVRLLFGSDEAAQHIERLDHPLESASSYFTDRISQGWIEHSEIDDNLVDTIIKVFAVYGQAGCTSPQRIVLIGGDQSQAKLLYQRILGRWSEVMSTFPSEHIASESVMTQQWSSALGWSSDTIKYNQATIAYGNPELDAPSANMFLPITWGSLEEALENLPGNIQTIGCALTDYTRSKLICSLAEPSNKPVRRMVPLAKMHHFHYVWDGYAFWRNLFTEIELGI